MAKHTRRAPLTDAERDARRQAERELLTQAVDQLKSSEGWLRWLRVRKAFHGYSMNNQLLIALQKPHATRVAGFQAWLKLGRCVRKGETAIKIFAPVPPSKTKLDAWRAAGSLPRDRPRIFFKLTSVFDMLSRDHLCCGGSRSGAALRLGWSWVWDGESTFALGRAEGGP